MKNHRTFASCIAPLALFMATAASANPVIDVIQPCDIAVEHIGTPATFEVFFNELTGRDGPRGTSFLTLDGSIAVAEVIAVDTCSVVAEDVTMQSVGDFILLNSYATAAPHAPIQSVSNFTSPHSVELERMVVAGMLDTSRGIEYVVGITLQRHARDSRGGLLESGPIAFAPLRLHSTAAAALSDAQTLAYDGALVSREMVSSAANCNQPAPWIWCHDPDGFCDDVADCIDDYQAAMAAAAAAYTVCITAANLVWDTCMGDCVVNGVVQPGWKCTLRKMACDAVHGIESQCCSAVRLGLEVAAELNLQACINNAKGNNGGVFPADEGCPPGWVPFPTQTPPSWGHVPCWGTW